MKLYTDAELIEKCIEFKPVPFAMEKYVLHKRPRKDRVSILYAPQRETVQDYQPINNITAYAQNIALLYPVTAENVIQEYMSIVKQKLEQKDEKVEAELSDRFSDLYAELLPEGGATAAENPDFDEFGLPSAPRARRSKEEMREARDMMKEDMQSIPRSRRTKEQMREAREMQDEDVRYEL